ncbi:MAG: hypothetical protein AB8C13_04005 [Phycisphaerales bacterium]
MIWMLLVSYAQGRSGVLDDCGKVIDTKPSSEMIPDHHFVTDEDLDESNQHGDEQAHRYKIWWDNIVSVGLVIISAIFFLWCAALGWRAGGWIGHHFFNVPGVLGNIAGSVAVLCVVFGISLLTARLNNARRDMRARQGKRNHDDLSVMFFAVDQMNQCGACGYSIVKFEDDDDGFILCPECGARWNRGLWIDFLQTDREGALKHVKKRHRRRTCLLDGRRQIYQVLMNWTDESRTEAISSRPRRLALGESLAVSLLFLISISGISGGFRLTSSPQVLSGVKIWIWVSMLFLTGLALYGIKIANSGIRSRQMRRLVRDLIDDRVCPHCDDRAGNLTISVDPHPFDGMLVCVSCGLAWDPDTTSRKHHSKKRITDERFKKDPVFN